MRATLLTLFCTVTLIRANRAAEFHVATNGDDADRGTLAAPLLTIRRAARLAPLIAQPNPRATREQTHGSRVKQAQDVQHVVVGVTNLDLNRTPAPKQHAD